MLAEITKAPEGDQRGHVVAHRQALARAQLAQHLAVDEALPQIVAERAAVGADGRAVALGDRRVAVAREREGAVR